MNAELPVVLGAFSVVQILSDASLVELFVLILLSVVSVFSWGLIAMKVLQLRTARVQSVAFLDAFWKGTRLDAIYGSAKTLKDSPLAKVFSAGFEELQKLAAGKDGQDTAMSERLGGIENVERSLTRAATSEIMQLESRVSFLGTIGSAAPFVGLFGTVVGIISAFGEIEAKGNATLATVSGPIGNALFATAMGLVAAIPAVVAYNSFVNRIRIFDTEMQNFSADFLNIVKRHFFK